MVANINEWGKCVILGNLNIHINQKDDQDTFILLNTLRSFALQNRLEFPTHQLQNMLDLIITEQNSNIIEEAGRGSLISDHNLIHFILQAPSIITTMKQVSYMKTKAIDISLLKSEVLMEVPCHGDCSSPDNFVELYNMTLNQLMDKFSPLKTKKVSNRLKLPWINDTVTTEVRKRRLEKWKKDINNNAEYQVFYKKHWTVCNIFVKLKRISTESHYITTRMISRQSSTSVTIC